MKNTFRISGVTLCLISIFLIHSCQKDSPPPTISRITTTAISEITQTSATSGGIIKSDGGASVSARGVCWSTTDNPATTNSKTADGTGFGQFVSYISGLTAGTVYHLRAYAINSVGTAYGEDITFTTKSSTSVTDADGNVYNIVIIGTQVWMAENLKTTKYNNNSNIPLASDPTAWAALDTPGYCWYNNDSASYKATYGALYNWYAVDAASNGGKNVCPTGWHVPTDAEWTTLTTFLGGDSVAGGKLKEIGTTHWLTPNTGATNETGFSALPGGFRNKYGIFHFSGHYGSWWGSSEYSTTQVYNREMGYDTSSVGRGYMNDKCFGFSVRCLKDN